jgi:NADH-quinone oxidoreductase subunit F
VVKLKTIKEFAGLKEKISKTKDPSKLCVVVSDGTCGKASGADKLISRLKEEIRSQNLDKKIDLRITGCLGFCQIEPIMIIYPKGVFYPSPKPADVSEILKETVAADRVIERLLYTDPISGNRITYEQDIPFYKKQKRIILGNNNQIDPNSIDDYIRTGGYESLCKVLDSYSPEQIIEEIKQSGLRGRGGAGFPTGRKWEITRSQSASPKYIICNADEGDPGAFMDRNILESSPHSVLEGMLIGAYAIGANEGYVYVRAEYPLACKHLEIAIKQAEEYGFLGDNILGTEFSFKVHIKKGAGAFVCGEESALIASIEGRPGEPIPRPPYPAEKGLWGKPTNINNVKTWASIRHIIHRGADWYSSIGTEKSKGTIIFSLVGKVNNTGLVEIPMGMTLKDMVYEIGGGIPGNKKLKAIQTGGPSGGCIPERLTTIPVDYEELSKIGSMMGSGGCVVMDEDTCMVDVAKYFLSFTMAESCGKCTPCREGNARLLDMLTRICEGNGEEGDIDLLTDLAETIIDGSLCALGKTAPNPVLTTVKYFRDEYIAHIRDKKCPAKVCKSLIKYTIIPEKCTGCLACLKTCPVEAVSGKKKEVHTIDQDKCTKCGTCYDVCRFEAVLVE